MQLIYRCTLRAINHQNISHLEQLVSFPFPLNYRLPPVFKSIAPKGPFLSLLILDRDVVLVRFYCSSLELNKDFLGPFLLEMLPLNLYW